jgi:hypothetical protein
MSEAPTLALNNEEVRQRIGLLPNFSGSNRSRLQLHSARLSALERPLDQLPTADSELEWRCSAASPTCSCVEVPSRAGSPPCAMRSASLAANN